MRRYPEADPGFEVRGADLKKIRRAEGDAKILGVFRVKNNDFTPKNQIFSNFRGSAPDININIETLLFGNNKYSYGVNSKIFGKVRTFINQSKRV